MCVCIPGELHAMRPSSTISRLPTVLAVPTKSPWVYGVRGVDTSPALCPPGQLDGFRAEFVTPASLNYVLPTKSRPELAFIGRSNVGKSTLVGKLLRNPGLVRTSKEPGCTTTVNFFALRNGRRPPHAYVVDLPGYGFARQKKEAIQRWEEIVNSYLSSRSRQVLQRTFVLVDSRHGIQCVDEEMLSFLNDAGVSNQVVLTKVDKVRPAQLLKAIESVCQSIILFPATCPTLHCVSALQDIGMMELINTMCSLMKSPQNAPYAMKAQNDARRCWP